MACIDRRLTSRPPETLSSTGGIRHPEQAERFQAVTGIQIPFPFEWRTIDRMQEIDRRRMDPKSSQFKRDIHEVAFALAHADDQVAAKFHAGIPDSSARFSAIFVAVR